MSTQLKSTTIKSFIKAHKILTCIIALVLFIAISDTINGISRSFRKAELQGRNYELLFDKEEYRFECNSTSGEECRTRIISGTTSDYSDIAIYNNYNECSKIGSKFECEVTTNLSELYEIDELAPESIPNELSSVITISIKDKEKQFYDELNSKKTTIIYTLSENDKKAIFEAHEKWLKKKAEEETAKKAEEEAKKKAAEEATKKAEEEAKKKAAEEATKKAENSKNESNNKSDAYSMTSAELSSAANVCRAAFQRLYNYKIPPSAYRAYGTAAIPNVFNLTFNDGRVGFGCKYNKQSDTADITWKSGI